VKPEGIIKKIVSSFKGVFSKSSWSETSLFYNSGLLFPNGVYFCTLKEKDGDNDKAANQERQAAAVTRISLPSR
jgi:hypothetical protein